jgi:hypothetical protein
LPRLLKLLIESFLVSFVVFLYHLGLQSLAYASPELVDPHRKP